MQAYAVFKGGEVVMATAAAVWSIVHDTRQLDDCSVKPDARDVTDRDCVFTLHV